MTARKYKATAAIASILLLHPTIAHTGNVLGGSDAPSVQTHTKEHTSTALTEEPVQVLQAAKVKVLATKKVLKKGKKKKPKSATPVTQSATAYCTYETCGRLNSECTDQLHKVYCPEEHCPLYMHECKDDQHKTAVLSDSSDEHF